MSDEKTNLSETNKKINDIKKKISLCEGKRRAVFSVGLYFQCFIFNFIISYIVEKEKFSNREKTFILQDDVKV